MCDKRCNKKRLCGRHKCNEICCVVSGSIIRYSQITFIQGLGFWKPQPSKNAAQIWKSLGEAPEHQSECCQRDRLGLFSPQPGQEVGLWFHGGRERRKRASGPRAQDHWMSVQSSAGDRVLSPHTDSLELRIQVSCIPWVRSVGKMSGRF